MEEESGKKKPLTSPLIVISQGPGLQFMPFVVMEDLLDKLKLLDYEVEFVSELRMRPLNRLVIALSVDCYSITKPSRHYFVLQTNPGEQFFMFSSLAAWLIRKLGNT